MIEIDEHDYQDVVNILEELRSAAVSERFFLPTDGVIAELNKALKLLTGEDYE